MCYSLSRRAASGWRVMPCREHLPLLDLRHSPSSPPFVRRWAGDPRCGGDSTSIAAGCCVAMSSSAPPSSSASSAACPKCSKSSGLIPLPRGSVGCYRSSCWSCSILKLYSLNLFSSSNRKYSAQRFPVDILRKRLHVAVQKRRVKIAGMAEL